MSKIVPVGGLLSVATLAAAHAVAHELLTSTRPAQPGLPCWLLGDDATAMRTLCDDLGFEVLILQREPGRDDLRRLATDRLRRISQRYRRDFGYGGVEIGSIDDGALRNPDGYGRQNQDEDQALAA